MKHLDLFSGIGGFALAARRVGWETVGFCEIDPWCHKVLNKHWPGVPIYEDVRDVTAERLRADGIEPSIITGGFPCQDISLAGKQAGIEGERSGLWSELCRIIGEVRPAYAVLENVSALLSGDRGRWFQRVLGDLAEIGYDCEWHCIPASSVGAPHRRDRVWIIAYPMCEGSQVGQMQSRIRGKEKCNKNRKTIEFGDKTSAGQIFSNTECQRPQGPGEPEQPVHPTTATIGQAIELVDGGFRDFWAVEPDVGRVAHGIPARVDRLRGLGNAIVPFVCEAIFRAIQLTFDTEGA